MTASTFAVPTLVVAGVLALVACALWFVLWHAAMDRIERRFNRWIAAKRAEIEERTP